MFCEVGEIKIVASGPVIASLCQQGARLGCAMDNHHDGDTETLIALVSSLLDHVIDHETILEALVVADGDVQRAAGLLNGNERDNGVRKGEGHKKRKKPNLDGWLKKAKISSTERIDLTQEEETSSSTMEPKSKGHSHPKPPLKPPVDLMAVLRPPPSPDKSKRKLKTLPPLMLTNPSMVAAHTPCTLHLSVLPPELACQLFYTMIDASKQWQRNKWWLFDRVVESPHRTSFYARSKDDETGDERDAAEWQEAARYWYAILFLPYVPIVW